MPHDTSSGAKFINDGISSAALSDHQCCARNTIFDDVTSILTCHVMIICFQSYKNSIKFCSFCRTQLLLCHSATYL